ncbi:hypothetical protein EDD36DRAFT_460091 [Exophiala viscosa]|uniref:Uncharacterized protein n=1 Tax=Exophiala viscosa TaxID=2486360 RepID=A0AAN6E6M9_9EURO|nr:hypothetical protein EDD36DRAFT_460091 [Exophiala viscosa]
MSQEPAFEVSELVNRWLGNLSQTLHEEPNAASVLEDSLHGLGQEPETLTRNEDSCGADANVRKGESTPWTYGIDLLSMMNTDTIPSGDQPPATTDRQVSRHFEDINPTYCSAERKNMKRRHDPDLSPPRHAPSQPRCLSPPQDKEATTDPADKYARRQRRKTRPDKYEYKGATQRASTLRQSKKLDHKKSWAVLNDEFQAPNVSSQRLTLRPGHGPGILANARTSGPIQRQGLPDLTFTEMDFLKKKDKHNGDPRFGSDRQVLTRKTHKAPNMNGEISNFFSRPENGKRKAPSPLKPSYQHCETPKLSSIPLHSRYPGPADPESRWKPDSEVPILKHFRPPSSHKPTPSHKNPGTSYVSWSRSPIRIAHAPTWPEAKSAADPRSCENSKRPLAQEVRRIETPTSINPHSSASNHFFKDFTTNALLGGVEAFAQKGRPYYSLDDLKDLAGERKGTRKSSIPVDLCDFNRKHHGQLVHPPDLLMEPQDSTMDTMARQHTGQLRNEAPGSRESVLPAHDQMGRTRHLGEESIVRTQVSGSARRPSGYHELDNIPGATPVTKDTMPPQYSSYRPSPEGGGTPHLLCESQISQPQNHAEAMMKDGNSPKYFPRPSSRTASQSLGHSSWWPSHVQHETSKTSATPLLSHQVDYQAVESVTRQDQFSVPATVPESRRPPDYSGHWRSRRLHEALRFPLRPRPYDHEYDEDVGSPRSCNFIKTASVDSLDDVANHEPSQIGRFEMFGEIEIDNPVDRHDSTVSDDLDDFDVQLLHMTSPKVSPRPTMAAAMPRFHATLDGEATKKQLEDGAEVAAPQYTWSQRRPQPLPVISSYDRADAVQNPSSVFSRKANYHLDDSTQRTLPFQHVPDLPGFPGQLLEQPKSTPYTGFARRHVLY